MRTSKSFLIKKLDICIGWFHDEDFKLFHCDFFSYVPKMMFVILDFQIAKFAFQIIINLY